MVSWDEGDETFKTGDFSRLRKKLDKQYKKIQPKLPKEPSFGNIWHYDIIDGIPLLPEEEL
jgi:hypothetical protein